jgi:heme/copper-type cytochrome/quinol oxidase subunit 3
MSHKPHFTPQAHEHADDWHHHSAEEGTPQAEHGEKPNIPILMGAFLASVAFVGATILATYLYFGVYTSTLRAERMENAALARMPGGFIETRDHTNQKLAAGNEWLNDDAARAGLAPVPLDKAKEKVIAKYNAK